MAKYHTETMTFVKVQNGWFSCTGVECMVVSDSSLVRLQLRFSLCSGAIITRCWFQFILYLFGLLVPTQLMQSYASCLLPSLLRCCICLLFLCMSFLVVQLFCCVSLSAVFGLLQPLLYKLDFTVHPGIVCPCCVFRDSMSSFPGL